jgi:glucose 1-dehydrogenase
MVASMRSAVLGTAANVESTATTSRFAGRTAVVSGAGAGIGAATARRFSREGAAVVVVDIDADRADAVVDELGAAGASAVRVHADVADETAWETVTRASTEAFGGIDVLVNNAASWTIAPAHELQPGEWRRQLEACLTSVYLGFRACHAELLASGGSVVNVSSVHALAGLVGHPAYAAAKGGIVALTRQLAVEYGPGVRVNAVLPGPILTSAWERVPEQHRAHGADATIAKRFGSPDEVAAAIAFLASDDASYITGAALPVDGGWSACK